MVKNLPTIERSTKIRFGKNVPADQAENTIVFNASNTEISATTSNTVYMTPVRLREDFTDPNIVLLMYNNTTKEITRTSEATNDLLNTSLDIATSYGNVINTSTVQFNNTEHTSFVTYSNVGIINTNPTHTLDIGSNLHVDEYGSNVLFITGNAYINGGLTVTGAVTSVSVENLNLSDAGILELAKNNTPTDQILDLGFVLSRPDSNVAIVFQESTDELYIGYTDNNSDGSLVSPLTDESINVHVYGSIFTEANVGILNTSPIHTLDVGSNLYIDEYGSNVLYVSGNTNIDGDITMSGSIISSQITDLEADIADNSSRITNLETDLADNSARISALTLDDVTNVNNATSNTVQFTNPTTAFTTDLTSNVEVKLNQLANVVIDTATLATEDMLVYNGGNWTNQRQNHTFLYAKAEETISKGDAVYATGTVGNNTFTIRKAQSNSSTTMPALGLAYQDLALNGQGLVVTFGRADGINTDNFQTGETVYVSNVTAGALSNVKPYASGDLIQNIGLVVKGHDSTGIVSVTGVGRSNDIPNASIVADEGDINYVYVNDANNDLKKILPANLLTQLQTLQQVTDTGNTTSNTIRFTNTTTSIVATSNIEVGSNISVAGLVDSTNKHLPMVGLDGFLEKSPIYFTTGGKYVVTAAEAEFLGNLTLSGNTTILSSNNVTIEDRIFGVGANNSATGLDSGFMIEHSHEALGEIIDYANIAIIHHAETHRLAFGYTQNTFSDDHILYYQYPDKNLLIDLQGNVQVQNNLTVEDTLDVTGAATFDNDLTVGAVSNLFVDVSTSRIGINEASPQKSLDVNGDARVQSTTDTSSKTAGALVVSGGLGVNSNIHSTNVYATSRVGVGTNAASAPLHILVSGTGETTNGIYMKSAAGSSTNDAIVNLEVASDGGDAFMTWNASGGAAFAMGLDRSESLLTISNSSSSLSTNPRLRMATDGAVTLTNTTNATSKTTGSLIIGGGVGVAGHVYASNLNVSSNIGIGVASPQYSLDVAGDINFTGGLYEDGSPFVSTPWTIETSPDALSYTSGNIGIGATNPDATLHVTGNTYITSNLEVGTANLFVNTATSNVGIGSATPGFTLDVAGDINFTGGLYEDGSPFAGSPWTTSGDDIYYTTGMVGIGTTSPDANLHVGGNVYVSEEIYAGGDITAFSDRRLKTEFKVIEDALQKIDKVSGYTFEKIDEPGKRKTGVIAQEILEILPEAIHGSENTMYSVAYGNMAGLFIEAIKELKNRIEVLEAKIK